MPQPAPPPGAVDRGVSPAVRLLEHHLKSGLTGGAGLLQERNGPRAVPAGIPARIDPN